MKKSRALKPIEQRLWAKVVKAEPHECWLWQAYLNVHGYGTIQLGNRSLLAHRVVYEIANGPFPQEMRVLHRCDNPSCCNPDHLWLGTQADNVADMVAKGRRVIGKMSAEAIAKREAKFLLNKTRFGLPMSEKTKKALNRHPQKRWETRRKTFVSLAASGRWSTKYECCVSCGTTERRHDGGGLCGTCYQRRE